MADEQSRRLSVQLLVLWEISSRAGGLPCVNVRACHWWPQVGANRFEALVAQALLSLSLTRPVLAVTPRKWGNELGLA